MEEYEYDPVLEPSYRSSMLKLFNKTLDEGYFPLVIVDAVNSKVCCVSGYVSGSVSVCVCVCCVCMCVCVLCVCSKVSDFDQFCANAKMRGFEVFIAEVKEDVEVCAVRNIHDRTREEILEVSLMTMIHVYCIDMYWIMCIGSQMFMLIIL